MSVDDEIGVMPMTAVDEIKLKSPDSLFNGEALYELFRSCVPDIVEPKEIPICDIDKLLLAIRMATSGSDLDIKSKCPKCSYTESYSISLAVIMNSAEEIPTKNTVNIDDQIKVEVKPLTLRSQIISQMDSFYQYRMQQMLNDDTMDTAERATQFNELLVQAITLQTGQIAESIISVTLDEETVVTDPSHIFEWVENMDSNTHNKIKNCIETLGD